MVMADCHHVRARLVTKLGNADPETNKSFARAGTQFGFWWKLVDYSLTFKATETMMYGYVGSTRKLDLFEGTVAYSFDPNDYFALEFNYQKGRDLDTTNRMQAWTLAFTAKY